MIRVIKQADYKVNEWAGGVTRELMITPEGSTLGERNFDVRISSAIIDLTESDFSDFTGYKRYILPVEGELTLFRANERIALSGDAPFLFDGSEKVRSENSQGAIDFNVIFKAELPVEVRVIDGKETTLPEGLTLLFALDDIEVNGEQVKKYDTIMTDEAYWVKGKAIEVAMNAQ